MSEGGGEREREPRESYSEPRLEKKPNVKQINTTTTATTTNNKNTYQFAEPT